MLRRRDMQIPDPAREREMHELRARLDDMETAQRHTVDAGDISEAESEDEAENEEVVVEDATEERIFRVVARIGARAKMDIPVYEGNLDVEELLD
jgi:Mn-dependent DtxR family transcriptional regulator